jgi:hypothetical protein
VAGFGFIFTQMEEPGFMFYTATMLGLRWQEQRFKTLATTAKFGSEIW